MPYFVLQWTFLNFPPFSVFLAIIHVLKCVFLIFDFQFSRHIPGPSVGISHFSRFLVISSFFKSSSGCFSFSMIFSFLAIFQVDISKFSTFFSFPRIFHVLKCVFLIFRDFQFSRHITGPSLCISHFSRILLKCVFLIFRDFQFSRHIPGPSVCISHFSRFLVISSFFKSSSGCGPTVDISKFSTFFSFPCHISCPKVYSHFP
ncbi:Uncharacterised protein [Chlamydia abortus]|nr:Uncharacterised protein [Chlamydia abortus]